MKTRVGYAGGKTDNPTYVNIGDHTETIQVDFDPNHITYGGLLKIFWESHNPQYKPWSRQYMSAIFYHDEQQAKMAIRTKEITEKELGLPVYSEIAPFTEFYLAEDYHQKYYLQQKADVMNELENYFNDFWDLVDSTVAAKLNGFVAGYGNTASFIKDLELMGMTGKAAAWFTSRVR